MTREHKVALIVGFSLILLIAVLLSDHFSRARAARVDSVLPGEVAMAQPGDPPVDPLLTLEQPSVPAPATTGHAPPEGDAPLVNEPARPASTPATEPVHTSGAGADVDSGRPAGTVVPGAGGSLTIRPAPATFVPETVSAGPPPPASPTGLEPARTGAPPKSSPPAESTRFHPVRKGENLYRIAEKYYGSGAAWKKLADANPDRVAPDGSVREGVRLRIPDVPAQEPKAASPKDKKEPPAAKPAATRPGPMRIAKDTRPRTYTVIRGDTLGGISQKTLGTSRRVPEIRALNGLDDEDEIAAGAILKIPGA